MRRFAALLVVAMSWTAFGCTDADEPAASDGANGDGGGTRGSGDEDAGGGLGSGNGYVDRREWRARQDDYLAFATEELSPSSPVNVLAHLIRAERDRSFDFDAGSIGPDDFTATFDKIDAFEDTSDFDLIVLMALWHGHRDDLGPDLRAEIEKRFLGFRYWFTDPLPEGGLDEKAEWGFSEWHSDVYYQEDIEALTMLAEHAEPELARRAAVMLDLFLFDLAVHQLKGNNGVTHGRSYMKDKSRAADQDVFGTVKLLFATTDQPYVSRSDTGATFLAGAERYRLPEVIQRVATTDRTFVDRTRMGVPIEVDQPFSTDPESPAPGRSFTDPDDVPFWWERGALTAWQAVPITLETIERHDLFETTLFKPFEPLVEITGGDHDVARELAYSLRCMINIGLLSAVDTVTWRSGDAMLSTVQDYRPGCYGNQYHAWQATLDEDAVVFTTLPGSEPREGDEWVDADQYWTGTGAMPRSAQQGAAAIHLYAPKYPPNGPGPLESFTYLDYTHAYFPTERFDEVRSENGWTLGRAGDGYVALWSWRPTTWRTHDPEVVFTNGLTEPFDLVAEGGADNAWIVEVGDAGKWGSFDEFAAAVTAAPVEVRDLGPNADGLPQGFEVSYRSPTEGSIAFSSTGPLTLDGEEVPLHGTRRFDNPFATTADDDTVIEIADGGASLTLDTEAWTRKAKVRGGGR